MFWRPPANRALWASRVCLLIALTIVAVPAAAQQAPPRTPPGKADSQTATLAQGWAALASGDLTKARAAAKQALTNAPNNPSALALVVEVEIAGGGATAGLDAYEQWMQSKKVEEPYVLRRLATAVLENVVANENAGPFRAEALRALVADGSTAAGARLAQNATSGRPQDPTLLAAAGDERAVQTLVDQLPSAQSKSTTIRALGESGSRLAIPSLIAVVSNGKDDDRAAAANALARLGAREAVDQIRPLLDHANFPLRFAGATALYRLGDDSGASFLSQMLVSEHPSVRLAAAEAVSVRPGIEWLDAARALTSEADESIQLGAARLVAPYDAPLAAAVLSRLSKSENLAVREETGRVLAERVVSDLAELRRILRSQDVATALRAARRLLELVR